MNDNYNTAQTGRGSPLDAMAPGFGDSRNVGSLDSPVPKKRRTLERKGRGNYGLPRKTQPGGSGLPGGNFSAVQRGTGLPGGNIPDIYEPTAATKTTKKMMNFFNPERLSGVIFALLVLFMAVTSRLPNKVHIEAPVQPSMATTNGLCTPSDVWGALDSGWQELNAAKAKFERARRAKTTIVTPLGSEEQR